MVNVVSSNKKHTLNVFLMWRFRGEFTLYNVYRSENRNLEYWNNIKPYFTEEYASR